MSPAAFRALRIFRRHFCTFFRLLIARSRAALRVLVELATLRCRYGLSNVFASRLYSVMDFHVIWKPLLGRIPPPTAQR